MNTTSRSDSYAAAGVDITAGYKAVELMKAHIAKTMTAGALSDIGGFGGLFELDLTGITKPVDEPEQYVLAHLKEGKIKL